MALPTASPTVFSTWTFPPPVPMPWPAAGRTSLASGSTITGEEVWNDLPSDGATGGGVSATFPLPTWQAGANVPPSVNPGSFVGRGLPDVAGDADPSTGYQVEVDGSNIVVGGTSAVAPLWAGLIACFNSQLKTPVGYLNPTLYQQVGGARPGHSTTSPPAITVATRRDQDGMRAAAGEVLTARRFCRRWRASRRPQPRRQILLLHPRHRRKSASARSRKCERRAGLRENV